MRKLNIPKDSYVDLSYGWQSRGNTSRRRRSRGQWLLVIVGSTILAVIVAGAYWWLG